MEIKTKKENLIHQRKERSLCYTVRSTRGLSNMCERGGESMELTEKEKQILENLLIERLLHNWDTCDKCSVKKEYNKLTDECSIIKSLSKKMNIKLPINIMGRF